MSMCTIFRTGKSMRKNTGLATLLVLLIYGNTTTEKN